MDKETAERLTKLETKQDVVEKELASWNLLIKNTIIKTLSWFVGVGTLGIIYGWHMPENVRKSIAEWVSK